MLDVGHCKISLQGAASLKPPGFHRQAGRPEIDILFRALSGYSIYEQQKTTAWDIKHFTCKDAVTEPTTELEFSERKTTFEVPYLKV